MTMRSLAVLFLLPMFCKAGAAIENAKAFQEISRLATKGFAESRSAEESFPNAYMALVKELSGRRSAKGYLENIVRTDVGSRAFLASLVLYRLNNPTLAKEFDPFYQPENVKWHLKRSFNRPQLKPFPLVMLSNDAQALAEKYPDLFNKYSALASMAHARLLKTGMSPEFRAWLGKEVSKLEAETTAAVKSKVDKGNGDVAAVQVEEIPTPASSELRQFAFASQLERHTDTDSLVPYHDYRFRIAAKYHLFLCEAALFSRMPIVKSQFVRLASNQDVDAAFFKLLAVQYLRLKPGKPGEQRLGQERFLANTMNGLYLHPSQEGLTVLGEVVSRTHGRGVALSEFRPVPEYGIRGKSSTQLRQAWKELLKQAENDPKMKRVSSILKTVKEQMWVFSDVKSDLAR